MRKVATPPDFFERFKKLQKDSKRFPQAMKYFKAVDDKNRYIHWDKLRYKKAPELLSIEDWWAIIKFARAAQYKQVTLSDKENQVFKLVITDAINEVLYKIDSNARGGMSLQQPVLNPQTQEHYLIRSLWEESISSSQLEGASTTRHVAKEMLQTKRQPRNKDEQMIYNNYLAMRFIQEHKDEELTPTLIYKLHKIVTEKTLGKNEKNKTGKLRKQNDDVRVIDISNNEILHTPPSASELPQRLEQLCQFANTKQEDIFLHPVIKAIILHFMLAYDHPFVDGNGRTARALFYWYMAKQNYWLMEYWSYARIWCMSNFH